jgi:hypothetical protein
MRKWLTVVSGVASACAFNAAHAQSSVTLENSIGVRVNDRSVAQKCMEKYRLFSRCVVSVRMASRCGMARVLSLLSFYAAQ